MKIILTHKNADFDAIASLLGAYKLDSESVPLLPRRLNRNVSEFLMLYHSRRSSLPFQPEEDFAFEYVAQITLVDTQRMPPLRGLNETTPTHIIDHHPLKSALQPHQTAEIETLGATTTLLVERIQKRGIPLNSMEATLLALGIYEDTGMLTYTTTHPRDIRAAAWLVEQQASLETVRRFMETPLTPEQQTLYDTLLTNADSRSIHGYTIMVCTVKVDHHFDEINSVAHRMRDALDVTGLFVLVAMPDGIQLVCRSTGDAVDVSEVARLFDGGGHSHAAAATINGGVTLQEAAETIWRYVYEHVQPVTRVMELMSYGVQTIDADKPVEEIIRHMRQIGHEGFPVVEAGQVVGLITRRVADRTIDHGLGNMTVREVMQEGCVTLVPDDSVSTLEQRMVETGWGQIPVVNEDGKLIGIVTRTDLINHWARTHPTAPTQPSVVAAMQVENVLGLNVSDLINKIAAHAQEHTRSLYMVGGAVRDLLLYRRNLDIDFVVEGNAIKLVDSLVARYGGNSHSHRPFGTAKWLLDEDAASALGISAKGLPEHLDFATSRNEFYEHPTALPTVYSGSIKLDLQRRDFTINTLAIQLSPAPSMWHILDYYGGLSDLKARKIRVLHSLSFVDDPTRILRAIRFAQRLGFEIEPRTDELIDTAMPMLRRITGKRVRNEIELMLRENHPAEAVLALQKRGVLRAIHPDFEVPEDLHERFRLAASYEIPWQMERPETEVLYWHLLLSGIPVDRLEAVCERLMIGRGMTRSVVSTSRLVQDAATLLDPARRPSEIVPELDRLPETALLVGWLLDGEPLRASLRKYMLEWRDIKPITTGHTLREKGLEPGPRYREILERLRAARLDGDIKSDDEERHLLDQLILQGDDRDDV